MPCQVTQVFKKQLFVIQFIAKIFHITSMQVLIVVEISMFKTSFCAGMYIPAQQDGSINIPTVYTATTQTDVIRFITTI